MAETFRYVFMDDLEPFRFQSIKEALVKLIGEGISPNTLILSNPDPYVSIGQKGNIDKLVNVEYCEENNIPIVRSFSPHDSSIFYSSMLRCSFYINSESSFMTGGAIISLMNRAVVETLEQLGVEVDYPVGTNNVLVAGKKIAFANWFTFPKTVWFAFNIILVSSYDEAEKAINSPKDMRIHTTSIESELGRQVSFDEMKDVLTDTFQQILDVDFEEGSLTAEEEALSDKLEVKNRSESWLKTGRWSPVKDYGG